MKGKWIIELRHINEDWKPLGMECATKEDAEEWARTILPWMMRTLDSGGNEKDAGIRIREL